MNIDDQQTQLFEKLNRIDKRTASIFQVHFSKLIEDGFITVQDIKDRRVELVEAIDLAIEEFEANIAALHDLRKPALDCLNKAVEKYEFW